MTPTEERALKLLIEWRNTRGEIALAFIELEMKQVADRLAKERREAEVENEGEGTPG